MSTAVRILWSFIGTICTACLPNVHSSAVRTLKNHVEFATRCLDARKLIMWLSTTRASTAGLSMPSW
ncbi:hypothetical protein PR003_g10771 [Phytophthora rubi]|uniref:Secreted protein n=1 Tax=Phytophthora rubi TaxID=129364 RepID=A0A6A4FDC9_9STRA|nr:hypothetical protein PR002_g11208 [Phytophthora rubi]KAE9339916.1 hypothetical protein PR003_g10771 [Phytophthora rubi]